jgi:serine/threonine-protein kinase
MAESARVGAPAPPDPGAFDEDERTQKVGVESVPGLEAQFDAGDGASSRGDGATDDTTSQSRRPPGARATIGRALADEDEDDDDEPTAVASAAPVAGRVTVPDPPPAEGAPPPVARIGKYDVVRRIAYGGMAEVFLARETTAVGASRLVAIKRALPHVTDDATFVEMFLDEARISVMLSHPHVCHLYDVVAAGAESFLVMEYIDGLSLAELILRARERSMLPIDVVVRVVAHIADALHYAHVATDEAGQRLHIVHRDVSPSNIMLGRDGRVKLLDFGVAKARTHATKTRSGVVKGKFAYMSPQQCLGHPVDGRADVFALGICLWEALAGRALFQRDSEYATMSAVLQDPVPSLRGIRSDVPADLDAIVQRALAKQPDQRFQSALELQAALEGWLSAHGAFVAASHVAELVRRVLAGEPALRAQASAGSDELVPTRPGGGTPRPERAPAGAGGAAARRRAGRPPTATRRRASRRRSGPCARGGCCRWRWWARPAWPRW